MTKAASLLISLTALPALLTSACSNDDASKSTDESVTTSAKTVEANSAKLEEVSIASMGLSLDVPAESLVDDNTATAGFLSGTIYANPTIFVVGNNEMFWKGDLVAQKAEIEKDPGNTFKKFTKEETAEGGFHLEYELTSMIDPGKTLYGFHIRTTIAGVEVDCSSNTQSPAEMARGVSMCKSLRAAK